MPSRNLSKEKREKLIEKIHEQMIAADDETKAVFNEIINELNRKKYGLVWEEHSEEVEDEMQTKIPVFTEDSTRIIQKSPNKPWNFLIEGDNLHALHLLVKTHRHKVDCIYIDPPYNTGARDWKYNNDYVDGNDLYRHSKWISFMENRLKIAKQLLNPEDSVLIVTIDENEVHHLRCLLEDIFSEAYIQMVTIVINKKGSSRLRFARVEEYALFVFLGKATVPTYFNDYLSYGEDGSDEEVLNTDPRWERLLRGGTGSRREDSPTLFYPVYVDPETKQIIGTGDIVPLGEEPDLSNIESRTIAWPIRKDGSFGRWQASPSRSLPRSWRRAGRQ